MSAYGALDTSAEDIENQNSNSSSSLKNWRERLGETLENEKFHYTVLGLTLLDAVCVVIQITFTFFHECQVPTIILSSSHNYTIIAFEIAEMVSMLICILFMLECLLSLIAFGPKYYLPGWPHWKLHLFDLTVISTTFILEVGLKGKEREIAGLLIIFRLWRVVKIIEAAIMGVSFAHEEELDQLKEDYEKLQAKYKQLVELNQKLTQRQEAQEE